MLEYQKNLQQISAILERVDPSRDDEALIALVAQYMCVRISGTIENAVRDNILRMLGASSHPRAINYINRRLGDFQNPKPDKIIQLFGQFDKSWAVEVGNFWEPEIKDAIGSIVGQRNLIAHGRATDISYVRVRDWFKQAKAFCKYLEQMQ